MRADLVFVETRQIAHRELNVEQEALRQFGDG
jgi:hypothetical protein